VIHATQQSQAGAGWRWRLRREFNSISILTLSDTLGSPEDSIGIGEAMQAALSQRPEVLAAKSPERGRLRCS